MKARRTTVPRALAELLVTTPLALDRAGHLRTASALTASADTQTLRLTPASRRRAEARVALLQLVTEASSTASARNRARLKALCNGGTSR